jgi:hypothetical protein
MSCRLDYNFQLFQTKPYIHACIVPLTSNATSHICTSCFLACLLHSVQCEATGFHFSLNSNSGPLSNSTSTPNPAPASASPHNSHSILFRSFYFSADAKSFHKL